MRHLLLLPLLSIGTLAWAASPASPAYPASQAQSSAQVPAAAEAGAGLSEDPAAELARPRIEQQKAWETLNNLNPLGIDYQKGAKGVAAGTGPFEQLNKILSQPAVQAYLRFFTNPVFSKGFDQIINSPQRMTLLYAELGFVVFMMLFRAWRFSKSSALDQRLWTRLWTLLDVRGGSGRGRALGCAGRSVLPDPGRSAGRADDAI